jgi:hypothetical protein
LLCFSGTGLQRDSFEELVMRLFDSFAILRLLDAEW